MGIEIILFFDFELNLGNDTFGMSPAMIDLGSGEHYVRGFVGMRETDIIGEIKVRPDTDACPIGTWNFLLKRSFQIYL